jgi:hypothetical protein
MRSIDDVAKKTLEEARQHIDQSEDALQKDCAELAATLATQGIGLARQAFALTASTQGEDKQAFQKMEQRTSSFLQSLAAVPTAEQGLGRDDLRNMERQLERARDLAGSAEYAKALKLLAPVADRLERRLVELLDHQSVTYSREFSSAAEEYAYLAEQYRGYTLLLELAKQKGKGPYGSAEAVEQLEKEGLQAFDGARDLAQEERWEAANESMELTDRCLGS